MIVVDCSVLAAGLFDDEYQSLSEEIYDKLESHEEQAIVPSLFFLEVGNVLLMAHKRQRITTSTWHRYLESISRLPIEVDIGDSSPHQLSYISKLAKQHELTTYDAAYLALAARCFIPLATLDKKLVNAAKSEGVYYEAIC